MKTRRKPIKCRHCILLIAGACPYPGARSVHRATLTSGWCELATPHPRHAGVYPDHKVPRPGLGPRLRELKASLSGSRRAGRGRRSHAV